MNKIALLLATAAILLSSCSGLKLSLKNSSVQKPSNVALYFSVETNDKLPVPGLAADMFHIYEDGELISPYESKQTILNPEVSVAHYTVLLMDLSGSITESGTLPALIEAASLFAEKVTKNEQIAVYGFDGSEHIIPVVGLTSNASTVRSGLNGLASYKVKDPSTNLHGAVVEAVHVVNDLMTKSKQPLRFGTLVIFTDGTDRAHRISADSMYTALRSSDINVFAIGMGGEVSSDQLAEMSTVGYTQAQDIGQITNAFNDVAEIIEAASRKFYLLSYCSPSRAGKHTLEVKIEHDGKQGSISKEFEATGFGPGCDPNKKPTFSVGRITVGDTHVQRGTGATATLQDSK